MSAIFLFLPDDSSKVFFFSSMSKDLFEFRLWGWLGIIVKFCFYYRGILIENFENIERFLFFKQNFLNFFKTAQCAPNAFLCKISLTDNSLYFNSHNLTKGDTGTGLLDIVYIRHFEESEVCLHECSAVVIIERNR